MPRTDSFAPYIERTKAYWERATAKIASSESVRHASDGAKEHWARFVSWVSREEHKKKAIEIRDQVEKAFTDHPQEAGENYLEHLWFTITMTSRLIYSAIVLLIHGIFPFLLVRTASTQIVRIYVIMKSRIPSKQRTLIDTNPSI